MEADDIVDDLASDDRPIPPPPQQSSEKVVFRSWRKKYRKMKLVFERELERANELFVAEYRMRDVARRIQQQNDQLMEILLEVNNSSDKIAKQQYDLESTSFDATHAANHTPDSQRNGIATKISLSALEADATHTSEEIVDPSVLPDDLHEDEFGYPGYLTPDKEERYLRAIDNALGPLPSATSTLPVNALALEDPSAVLSLDMKHEPSERDFSLQHPCSVHNWLRKYEPQVFETKDKDSDKGEDRVPSGRNKKSTASRDRLSKQDAPFEGLDEEIGFDARAEEGHSVRRKRKEDETYRPKGGRSRPSKRKRDKEDTGADYDGPGSSKKAKKHADDGD